VGAQAVGLLEQLGYANVRHYAGGIKEWRERGGPVETGPATSDARPGAPGSADDGSADARPAEVSGGSGASRPVVHGTGRDSDERPTLAARRRRLLRHLADVVGTRSISQLLLFWVWMVLGFAFLYWVGSAVFHKGLVEQDQVVSLDLHGLLTSIYFSFVTALSIGYGDVVPGGWMRAFAIAEGACGLLTFGVVISKLVSRRQEEVIDETHRIAFEARLGRVRTNLHLVLSDLQMIADSCSGSNVRPDRLAFRLESAVAIFEGELRTVHDLLYRPQVPAEEDILESILANLAANMQELSDLILCLPAEHRPSQSLRRNLRSVHRLAGEICGECVPRAYAPDLKEWMDRIQEHSRRLEARG
jgi:potassium channel LctB